MFANLIAALQPFARVNDLELDFECNYQKLESFLHPELIIPDLTKLLCRIMAYTPQEYQVKLQIPDHQSFDSGKLKILIMNSGPSLEVLYRNIIHDLKMEVGMVSTDKGGTSFLLEIPIDSQNVSASHEKSLHPLNNSNFSFPPFFRQLSDHLTVHLSNIQKLERSAIAKSPREGVFLKKVNAIILANLENECFDIVALSKAMALSRSQLYRRLKPLISHSPSKYIRYIRLQRAKELLDTSELTAGEIAFRTGFINQSHFSRIFKEQFGFNPSDLKQNKIAR
jgi:AraC-like DNA-binding protein